MSEYEALARNVIRKSLQIKPKESVIVECWNHGFDAAKEIVYQLRALGAKPMLLFEDEETYWRSLETLPPSKLGQVSRSEWAAVAQADAYIFLPGPADIARLRQNMATWNASTRYNSEWYRRAAKAGVRGARLQLGYTSRERALSYGFDFEAWRAAVLEASSADFGAIARKAHRVAQLLARDAEVEVSAPNGTSLRLHLKGRPPKCDDGIVDAADLKAGDFMTTVPSGSSYVAPDETSGEGAFVADRPLPYLGAMLQGLRFAFEGGRATWSAEKGEEILRPMYDKATGGKDRLSAISIGVNPAARYGFLQDDIVAGSVEVSIGDNAEWGGRNKSTFSLSARLSRATVKVGNKTIVDGGQLRV